MAVFLALCATPWPDSLGVAGRPFISFFLLCFIYNEDNMAEVTEAAESKQHLLDLKGRMLALKEHL